jgi:membrane associated rhomboid family serine protease/antitoxin component YwqK of YwqJK toxin-antitoxin module
MPQSPLPLTFVRRVPFTVSLILINIGVFIFTFIKAGTMSGPQWTITLLRLGAQFNPLALDGEWYRIFTHMFLHGSILHLAANMYVMAYLGSAMEWKVGTRKFAFVYFVSAIASAFSGLYWNLFTVGLGTSGAISGLLGFSLVYHIFFPGKSGKAMMILLLHFAVFVSVNLVIPEMAYADYAAQFGGVIAGIIIGFFSFGARHRATIGKVRIEYLMIGLLLILYFLLPRNQVRYFKFFKQVVAAEDTTKHLLKEKLTDDDMRTFIRNYHHWDDILTRLNDQRNLPVALASDTFKLRKYISLRKQENLFKKMVVQRETYTYLDSVEHLHQIMQQYLNLDYGLWSRIRMEPEAADPSMTSGMIKVFYDSNGIEIPAPPGVYYRVGYRDSVGRWDGLVRDYYRDGNIKMKGTFRKNKRDGVFLFYSDHKTYTETGRYFDDRKFGKWQTFHENGKLASEIFYNKGQFIHSLWDSVGNRLVVDGNGREIQRYPNGVVALEGEYRHGMKEGSWYGRHPNGELYFEEYYNQGRLVSGQSRTLEGETFIYDESSLYPMPAGGFERFQQYVKSEAKKVDPDELGHVKLSFRVTAKGALTDLSIVQHGSPVLDAKAKEILLHGPRWLPPRKHGHEPFEGVVGELVIEFY